MKKKSLFLSTIVMASLIFSALPTFGGEIITGFRIKTNQEILAIVQEAKYVSEGDRLILEVTFKTFSPIGSATSGILKLKGDQVSFGKPGGIMEYQVKKGIANWNEIEDLAKKTGRKLVDSCGAKPIF